MYTEVYVKKYTALIFCRMCQVNRCFYMHKELILDIVEVKQNVNNVIQNNYTELIVIIIIWHVS